MIELGPADPDDPDLRSLVTDHLADMVATTPDPRSRHALGLEALLGPGVTLWTARLDGRVVGTGALKEIDADAGELKAMRTTPAARGRGVGSAVLDHLLAECSARGYRHVHLETGAQDFFAPARRLYTARGFVGTGPFGAYVADPSSVFMRLDLPARQRRTPDASPRPSPH